MIERRVFLDHFARAAESAREFGQEFVVERLPDSLVFDVLFKETSDVADDGTFGIERGLSLEAASACFFRDGRVPVWIDLSVAAEDGARTTIEAHASRRFASTAAELMHHAEGYPPFHVQGPTLPPWYEEGERFPLNWARRRRGVRTKASS